MGRPKGKAKRPNKYWSKEEKHEYVQIVLLGEMSISELARTNNMNPGQISTWVKKYQEGGLDALENKRKPGNPLSKFQNRKELTELEQLEYENLKLKIENERLKKGYTTEEVMRLRRKK